MSFMPAAQGYPITVLVGHAKASPANNITLYVDLATVKIEETGIREAVTLSFSTVDITRDVEHPFEVFTNVITDEGWVIWRQGADEMFRGYFKQIRPVIEGISRRVNATAVDIGALLDRKVIYPPVTRPAGESDKARIQYLLSQYGVQFVNHGSSDMSQLQTLNNDMPKQEFKNMTLRQAIERVLGTASPSSNYYVDTTGRLHTWDNDNPEAFTAPFEVAIKRNLDSNEIAPEDLQIEWDTSTLVNYYVVRGKNATSVYYDTTSAGEYGTKEAYVDAPDADSEAKRLAVGLASLKDTKDPIPRGSFSVQGSYCENDDGKRWTSGQRVYVTSPAHGIMHTPYRITRVTTTYLNGRGERHMEIEFGGNRRPLRSQPA